MEKDISKIALQKIDNENIKPKSRVKFIIKKLFTLSAIIFLILISSLAFSIIFYQLINNDWDVFSQFKASFIIATLPYAWFVFLAVFIALSDLGFKKTKFGYKYTSVKILIVLFLISLFGGTGLYAAGVSGYIEKQLSVHPVYRTLQNNKEDFWTKPEQGLLGGEIISTDNDQILIRDFQGKEWTVNTSDSYIGQRVEKEKGEIIKIIGKEKSKNNFTADEVRPWSGPKDKGRCKNKCKKEIMR